MTKKDYQLIVDALRENVEKIDYENDSEREMKRKRDCNNTVVTIAMDLCDKLEEENVMFNRKKFQQAIFND